MRAAPPTDRSVSASSVRAAEHRAAEHRVDHAAPAASVVVGPVGIAPVERIAPSPEPVRELDRAAFTWRLVIVAALVAGLMTADHRLQLFTSQASVIALGYFAAAIHLDVVRRTGVATAPRLRGAVTFWLLTSMLVAHLVDRHGENPLPGLFEAATPGELLANRSIFLLHYVVPVLALVDFLVFTPHGATRFRDVPLWLAFPAGYVVMAVGRAVLLPESPDRYPYGFLDPAGVGYGTVGLEVIAIGAGLAVLAAVLIGLDRLRSRLR